MAVTLGLHLLSSNALAADNTGNWRTIFDWVMRWLNFGILAFILVKYSKTPIRDFFGQKREEIARQIKNIENEKEKAEEKIKEARRMLDESKIRFADLKKRIIADGEKKKQMLIEEARQESKILLESARKKIDNQFIEAQQAFKSELAEMAISLAIERLPKKIRKEDNQKWVNDFIASVNPK
jgi:F-type H+-transporting ATPase subunit b